MDGRTNKVIPLTLIHTHTSPQQIQKKEAQALANAKHAALKTAKTVHHIKHAHKVKPKKTVKGQGHGHKKTLHGHKKDGHLHLRALQQQAQAAQAAVAERLNLSPEDVAALRYDCVCVCIYVRVNPSHLLLFLTHFCQLNTYMQCHCA